MRLVELLMAAASVAFPCFALSASTHDPVTRVADPYPQVRQVMCMASNRAGSAFRVSHNIMVSAAHVTRNKGCTIDGQSFTVLASDGEADWSIIYLPGGEGAKINCEGFKPGQWYYAVGYAHAVPWQTIVGLFARFDHHISGMALFNHMAIPGQSGGAVFNLAGEIVGIVNARNEEYDISFSRALKDTPLCR